VHILPFYPSSADRGFSPLTYSEVDGKFGSWEDIHALGKDYELMADFMVNHISRQSHYFKDFIEKGDTSKWGDLFLRFKKLSPTGELNPEDLKKVYTRKPRPPYLEIEFPDAAREKVWCTFDYEQIDIDVASPVGKAFIRDSLIGLSRRSMKMLRIDAFAYATKKLGTNCFFVEPDVWDLLTLIEQTVKPFGVEILPEIHEHYSIQLKIAERGFWVYDFALPMLCLQAIYDRNSKNLINWLRICPRKQITTLDTHDGLGVVDVADLMTPEEIETTRENLFSKGANVQRRYSTDSAYQNLDIYQINCTYYSALGDNDDAYILARAIQMFTPGIPQIYYVGLLAGRNDINLVEHTKNGRDINRHGYTFEEIEVEVERPVVKRLLNLIKFRNTCLAFNGELAIHEGNPHELNLQWRCKVSGEEAILKADLEALRVKVEYRKSGNSSWQTLEGI
jgi:sucrose phosphorylase